LKWLHDGIAGCPNSNRQLAMKKSRAKQRGTSIRLKFFGSLACCPSCLAGYFTWPQVALTHHAFHRCLYASRVTPVKLGDTAVMS
jgi:hypothetical protein